jgi:hypothetical protein
MYRYSIVSACGSTVGLQSLQTVVMKIASKIIVKIIIFWDASLV